jgi:hypothetical protein
MCPDCRKLPVVIDRKKQAKRIAAAPPTPLMSSLTELTYTLWKNSKSGDVKDSKSDAKAPSKFFAQLYEFQELSDWLRDSKREPPASLMQNVIRFHLLMFVSM